MGRLSVIAATLLLASCSYSGLSLEGRACDPDKHPCPPGYTCVPGGGADGGAVCLAESADAGMRCTTNDDCNDQNECTADFCLYDFCEFTDFPDGLNTPLHERGGNLSMGQRQLLSFARVLAHDPDVLILDEATGNIDTETEKLIQEALGKLLKNRTSLVIAHRLSTIRNADRIIVLQAGRIVEQGPHKELYGRGGEYTKLYSVFLQDDSRRNEEQSA